MSLSYDGLWGESDGTGPGTPSATATATGGLQTTTTMTSAQVSPLTAAIEASRWTREDIELLLGILQGLSIMATLVALALAYTGGMG